MLQGLPFSSLQLREGETAHEVWDPCRRKWLKMSPEEMVRQQLVAFLHQHCGVPYSLMALERKVLLGERPRRFDLAVMQRDGNWWMLAECKAPDVPLNGDVLSQALSYLSQVPGRYLLLSNGHSNLLWDISAQPAMARSAWPVF